MLKRFFAILVCALALSACDMWKGLNKKSKDIDLNQVSGPESRGPEIKGMEASLLEQAQNAMEAQSYDKAIQVYKQLLDKNPENPIFNNGIAENIRLKGDYAGAILYYDKVLAKDAYNLDSLEGKALAKLNQGDMEGAGTDFNSIIQRDPKRWRAQNGLGIISVLKGDIPGGLERFTAALQGSGHNASILNNIGLALAINQDYVGAIKSLELAASTLKDGTPQRKKVDNNLATVYGINGDMGKAENLLRKNMLEAEVYNNLGILAKFAKNPELAKSYLNMALISSPVYYRKAWENLKDIQQGSNR